MREMNRAKVRLGVPLDLASYHTFEVSSYVIEGQVLADAIKGLLAERPRAKRLAVPGMPVGSPGMEVQGAASDAYDVVLFGDGTYSTFAGYWGARGIKKAKDSGRADWSALGPHNSRQLPCINR